MDRGDDARLVEQVRGGDPAAFAPLFERWYDRVYDVARGVVRRPELAADVAQDTFIAAWQQLDRLENVEAFGGWLLRIARYKALDAIRRESRAQPTGVETVSAMQDRGMPEPAGSSRLAAPVDFVEANEDQALVWAAAAALGERDASVLDLHLRHGLTPGELAEDLGVTPNHAHQLMHRMRTRLQDAVGAFLLWRDGVRSCDGLRAVAAPVFDARTAAAVRKHERSCPTCQDERSRRTSPVALFSAAPIISAPLIFRARAAQALATEGVPMRPELLEMAGDDPFGQGSAADRPAAEDRWEVHPEDPTTLLPGDAGLAAAGFADAGFAHEGDVDDGPPMMATGAHPVPGAVPDRRDGDRRRVLAAVGAAAVAMLAVAGLVMLLGVRSDGDALSGDGNVAGAPPSLPSLDADGDGAAPTEPVVETTSTTSTTTSVVPVAPPTLAPPTSEPVDAPAPTDTSTTAPPPPATPPPTDPPPPPTDPPPPPTTTTTTTTDAPQPTTTTSTLPATTTTTTVPRPVIWTLTIGRGGQDCRTVSAGAPYEVVWSTEHASSVSLAWPTGSQGVGSSGTLPLCLLPGDQVTLSASSATGTASSTVTAP